jgi:hypothetical protein
MPTQEEEDFRLADLRYTEATSAHPPSVSTVHSFATRKRAAAQTPLENYCFLNPVIGPTFLCPFARNSRGLTGRATIDLFG